MAASVPNPTPSGYFRRWIEGSDFSLEANTPAVPGKDRFYVLVAGEVCLDTRSFAAATVKYESLCVAYWEQQLTHADLPTRLLAARGLFRHNRDHLVASQVLTRQGDERDRAAVVRACHQRDRAAVVSARLQDSFASRKGR